MKTAADMVRSQVREHPGFVLRTCIETLGIRRVLFMLQQELGAGKAGAAGRVVACDLDDVINRHDEATSWREALAAGSILSRTRALYRGSGDCRGRKARR